MSGQQAAFRAAGVAFMADCAAASGVRLQVYRARPASVFPPTGFIDAVSDTIDFTQDVIGQHKPVAKLLFLWGTFDSGSAVDQRDAYIDAIYDWIRTRFHEAGPNSIVAVTAIDDVPTYTPDWQPPSEQRAYYATEVTLEGTASD